MRQKKDPQKEKEYAGYVLSVYLANECYQRDNQSEQATDSRYDGTIRQSTLASVLADKASVMQHRLTAIGYFKIVVQLFKVAFFRKKVNGSVPVFRGFFVVQ